MDLPYPGQILRAALGLALRSRGCPSACQGGCRRTPGCAYHELFEPDDRLPRFRLDLSGVRWPIQRGESWELRLFADDVRVLDAVEMALYRGLGPDRACSRVLRRTPLRHGGEAPEDGTLDLTARADALVGRSRVRLTTPAHLQRRYRPAARSTFITRPTLTDVLASARRKAATLGWPAPELPDVSHHLLHSEVLQWHRWSSRQDQEVPMEGVRAEWRAVLDPAAAWLLAVAEVTGVGKHGTMGLGGVRVWSERWSPAGGA